MIEPFVLHVPSSWRKLRQLIDHGERKGTPGFVARYKAACDPGLKVELPPNVVVRRLEEDGSYYFVAGPHERYYRLCPDCEAATGGPAIL